MMSGNNPLMIEDVGGSVAPEIFALTDEQILEMAPEGADALNGATHGDEVSDRGGAAKGLTPEGVSYRDGMAPEPPGWLAREMKDPWVGDEARELWEGVQRAQREAVAYREAFGTPEDARALKEIYPGGVAEAKGAAERARELAEIDAVFFGAVGKPAEELRAGRTALVEKLFAQNPAAFREMVEAGARLLERAGTENKVAAESSRSLHSESQTARLSGRDDSLVHEQQVRTQESSSAPSDGKGARPPRENGSGQAGAVVPQELASRYREFERVTNAELEKSVGGTIGRAMEAALPNLRQASGVGGEGQAPPLQTRLAAAVREEVETALRSDASLGEQVARVLSGRRLDEAARAQVVRLIDARAQQLVPGAVRRVVGSWTQATLGAQKRDSGAENAGRVTDERRAERAQGSSQKNGSGNSGEERNAQTAGRGAPRGRVDYRKLSDEQILGM
ncbi:MAG TPA: hypothetical protein VFI45_10215 [Candidatus Acidoferrum sp.]|nr:hypothetical protein [Candidatus Acidoferrum sp.]